MKRILLLLFSIFHAASLCITQPVFAEEMPMIYAYINDSVLMIKPAENSSAEAFVSLLRAGDLTVEMHDYGNFEKVGPVGSTLPRNDEPITTEPGDVILYLGTQITIYYDVNHWDFTRLGRVQEQTPQELRRILGSGNVTVRFSLTPPETRKVGVFDYESGTVLLNSGFEMPVIGLGTWTLSNEEAENSVYHALKSGMRLIDTARSYQCEPGVGGGLNKALAEGIITREEVFITSKIMPGDYDRAATAIDDSLSDMGIDYLDLMLIHQPGWNDEAVYRAMEDAVRAGKIRSIGISNYYTIAALDEVLSYAEIMPAVIQNENHLYYQNTTLRRYAAQYGIVMEAWYPFGGRGHTQEHMSHPVITEIAAAHDKTPAQVILRWQIQSGYIAIPGSSNPDHIAENFDIFDFELSTDEMKRINDLDRLARYESW